MTKLVDFVKKNQVIARIDGGSSQTFAASTPWQELLPMNQWVHLAATFDFTDGTMALYRNGQPVDGFYTVAGDPWLVNGPGPHVCGTAGPPVGTDRGAPGTVPALARAAPGTVRSP